MKTMHSKSSYNFLTLVVLVLALQVLYGYHGVIGEACLSLAGHSQEICTDEPKKFYLGSVSGVVLKSCPTTFKKLEISNDYQPSSVYVRNCQCTGKCGEDANCTQIKARVQFINITSNKTEMLQIPVDCLCVKRETKPGITITESPL